MLSVISWLKDKIGKILYGILIEEIKKKNKIEIEQVKKDHQIEIESFKKKYQIEIEKYKYELLILKDNISLYHGEQVKLYTNLWKSLIELKNSGSELWEDSTHENIKKFAKLLETASDELEKSSLFIEEDHYNKLRIVMDIFKKYQFGKKMLIQLYKINNIKQVISQNDIEKMINLNRQNKIEYESLIENLRTNLISQIRGRVL